MNLLPQQNHKPTHVVGVGASAGGLEAIEQLFAQMPADTGMAFVVIQHLSPDYKSLMVELLSKRTPMPVCRVEDGMVAEPNSVYLIPPKKELTIFHGKLLLTDQDLSRGSNINLPIDAFFRSLAEDRGESAVGIVLSGTGSDGTRGVRSIKEHGGLVLVQSPDSAKFDGMPRSAIATGLADFILSPEQIPAQLVSVANHQFELNLPGSRSRKGLSIEADSMTRLFALLRNRCGVDFSGYKTSTTTRRVERRIVINKLADLDEYVAYAERSSSELTALYKELLIGVTSFFRDTKAFDRLEKDFLPELLRSSSSKEVRMWIAGCSTGEEAYTLAIITREILESLGLTRDVKIFATDIDQDAILHAGGGVYPMSIAADIRPELLEKYFYRREDRFHIMRTIREMVVFAQHNVVKDPPFTNIDLVSCRNLLIYLQPAVQRKVLDWFNFSLKPAGILMLGTSEATSERADYFEALDHSVRIFKARGLGRHLDDLGQFQAPSGSAAGPHMRPTTALLRSTGRNLQEQTLERLLMGLSQSRRLTALAVNDKFEVLHTFGETRGLFSLPVGRVVNDITKMAHQDLTVPLATGIPKAFRRHEEQRYTNIRLVESEPGGHRFIDMTISPLPQKSGQDALVAVIVSDRENQGRAEDPANLYDMSQDAAQRIRDLEHELQFTRENLQATIEELETANEELQATNEELLASNEELQSTNEELQSTNEELHTVNTEHHKKILELTELTNDIDNLLEKTQFGKLLLDENLDIRRFSPPITDIFNVTASDIGRPISHLRHNLLDVDIIETLSRVAQSTEMLEREVKTKQDRWYLMRVMPYRIAPDLYSGLVATFIEITSVKLAVESKRRMAAQLDRAAKLAKIGSWVYDSQNGTQTWDRETFRIFDLDPEEGQPSLEEGLSYCTETSRKAMLEAFERARRDGEPYSVLLELSTRRGQRRFVRAIGVPEYNGETIFRIDGIFQDVTELTELSHALEARRAEGAPLPVEPS